MNPPGFLLTLSFVLTTCLAASLGSCAHLLTNRAALEKALDAAWIAYDALPRAVAIAWQDLPHARELGPRKLDLAGARPAFEALLPTVEAQALLRAALRVALEAVEAGDPSRLRPDVDVAPLGERLRGPPGLAAALALLRAMPRCLGDEGVGDHPDGTLALPGCVPAATNLDVLAERLQREIVHGVAGPAAEHAGGEPSAVRDEASPAGDAPGATVPGVGWRRTQRVFAILRGIALYAWLVPAVCLVALVATGARSRERIQRSLGTAFVAAGGLALLLLAAGSGGLAAAAWAGRVVISDAKGDAAPLGVAFLYFAGDVLGSVFASWRNDAVVGAGALVGAGVLLRRFGRLSTEEPRGASPGVTRIGDFALPASGDEAWGRAPRRAGGLWRGAFVAGLVLLGPCALVPFAFLSGRSAAWLVGGGLLVGGSWALRSGWRKRSTGRALARAAASGPRASENGLVALQGRAHGLVSSVAPLSGRTCVYWQAVVQRKERRSDEDWDCLAHECSAPLRAFERVGDGRHDLVWAVGARIFADVEQWSIGSPGAALPQRVRSFLEERGIAVPREEGRVHLRAQELRIEEDATLTVIGTRSEPQELRPLYGERQTIDGHGSPGDQIFWTRGAWTRNGVRAGMEAAGRADPSPAIATARSTPRLGVGRAAVVGQREATELPADPPDTSSHRFVLWRGDGRGPFVISTLPLMAVLERLQAGGRRSLLIGAVTVAIGVSILFATSCNGRAEPALRADHAGSSMRTSPR